MRDRLAKEHLQHELLNLMTILQLTLHEAKCPRSKKGKYFHLCKLIQTLIRFESVLLGQENNTCKYVSDTFLREVIQSSLYGIESIIDAKQTQIENLKTDIVWNTDRNILSDGLSCILYKLLDHGSKFRFEYDIPTASLMLKLLDGTLPSIERNSLPEIIDRENIRNNNLMFQLGLALMGSIGIVVSLSKNTLTFRQN